MNTIKSRNDILPHLTYQDKKEDQSLKIKPHPASKQFYSSHDSSFDITKTKERKIASTRQKKIKKAKNENHITLFIEDIAKQAQVEGVAVIDLVSGKDKKSVLKRMYNQNNELALELLKRKVETYRNEYTPEETTGFLGFFTYQTEATEAEEDLYEIKTKLENLTANPNEELFDDFMHALSIFEEQQQKVCFEACFDLTLLKTAGIRHSNAKDLPNETEMFDLLNPKKAYSLQQKNTRFNFKKLSNKTVADICNAQRVQQHKAEESKKLEHQIAAIKTFIHSDNKTLWLIEEDLTDADLKTYLSAKKGLKATCIQKLNDFLKISESIKTLKDQKNMLRAKDILLKAQIEYLFEQVAKFLSQAQKSPKTDETIFTNYLTKIATLEGQRPPEEILLKDTNWYDAITGIGVKLLRQNEVPTHQKLRNLYLEYKLKQNFEYDFTTEIVSYGYDLSGKASSAAKVVTDKIKDTIQLVSRTVTGKISLSESLRSSILITKGGSSEVLETLKTYLKDYTELCKIHPQMARMLAGNIAQTMAVIEATVGTNSEIYDIFNQLNRRIGAEAMACYMIEEFSFEDMNLEKLPKENVDSLKRMFALCQFFQWAPEAVVGMSGATDIAFKVSSGSVFATGLAMAKTVFRVATTHVVKNAVTTLSNDEVKLANTAILTIQHGPEQAAHRIQAMQATADFIIDQSQGVSATTSIIKTVFRPLTVRFSRIKKAFKLWKKTSNTTPLVSETLKLIAVVGPTVGAVVGAPLIGLTLGPAFIGYYLGTGLITSWSAMKFFYKTDVAEDAVMIIKNRATKFLQPNINNMLKTAKQLAKDHLKNGAYQNVKKRLTYVNLYNQYQESFKEQNGEIFESMQNEIKEGLLKNQEYKAKATKTQALVNELKALEHGLTAQAPRDDIINCVAVEFKNQVPLNEDEAVYWCIARTQYIKEFLLETLGTDLIPTTAEDLAKIMLMFNVKIAMAEYMTHCDSNIKRAQKNVFLNTARTVNKQVKNRYQAACLKASDITIQRATKRMVSKKTITTSRLDSLQTNKPEFRSCIKTQIKFMQQVLKPVAA